MSDIAPRILQHIMGFGSTVHTKHPKLHTSQCLSIPPFLWDKCLSRHPPKIKACSVSPLYHRQKSELEIPPHWKNSAIKELLASRIFSRLFSSTVQEKKIFQPVATSTIREGRKKPQKLEQEFLHDHRPDTLLQSGKS